MDSFLREYRTIKREWRTAVDTSAQESIKNIVNSLIYHQHIQSFEIAEWGELSDFGGLCEALQVPNMKKIEEQAQNLYQVLSVFDSIIGKLEKLIESAKETILLIYSMPLEKFLDYNQQMLEAYQKELKLRKIIVEELVSLKHLQSPYEVLVTITAMWSSKLYTSDITLGPIEKLLDFEVSESKRQKA